MTSADVAIILDLRRWGETVDEPAQFTQLWDLVEGGLNGRDLSRKAVHILEDPSKGDIHLGIAWIRPGISPIVTSETRFSISTVLDPPKVQYQCMVCGDQGKVEYGPFLCGECNAQGQSRSGRLCDAHVRILDGALIATCDTHAPACADCSRPAAFRCNGVRCRGRKAHCGQHKMVHPYDADHTYCPDCYVIEFPSCEIASCGNIGASWCEVLDGHGAQCGKRMCAVHLRRWQVFGGEALGLGLCAAHATTLPTFGPEEVIRQIVLADYLRTTQRRDAEPLPSLQGFAHNVRKVDRAKALDYQWIFRQLNGLETGYAAGHSMEKLRLLLRNRRQGKPGGTPGRGRKSWETELKEIMEGAGRGAQLVDLLRDIVRRTLRFDAEDVARSLALAEYKPPRSIQGQNRPGMLFVHLPEQYHGAFIGRGRANIDQFSAQLSAHVPGGVTVQIERDKRGGRR